MLDLNFVRDNLPLVEEKLLQRGMNPADVLRDFTAIDGDRRQAITVAETLLARRNRASRKLQSSRKAGRMLRRSYRRRKISGNRSPSQKKRRPDWKRDYAKF